MSPAAASIEIAGAPPTPDTTVVIRYLPTGRRFILAQADGEVIAYCDHPRPLAQYAWANGVLGVRHDYDLKIVEDMEAKERGSAR